MAWARHGSRTAPLPPNWRTIRAAVLVRDQHRCVLPGCTTPTDRVQVDHMGDPSDHSYDQLRTLCHGHHAERTAEQAAAVRHRYRERRPAEQHPGLS
jgi:5-methylcytosine-specific restriction protein A